MELETVGNWERNPDDISIDKEGKMGSVPYVWENQLNGDILVIYDLGVGGDYTIYHIESEYVTEANELLKKFKLQSDSAVYSHGAVIERSVDEEEILELAEEYMKRFDRFVPSNQFFDSES